MPLNPMISVLFVCLGNICRSPLAEGVFRHKVAEAGLSDQFFIDSAGTGGWHAGDPPDRRSIAVAARYGIAIHEQCARKLVREDFDRFDLILGLDRQNLSDIRRLQPTGTKAKVGLYLEQALGLRKDVPDPYYGGPKDFETVYGLCEDASVALLKQLTGPDFAAT
ncbi:low molecular weight protein-tyrosine-phosphatase [Asticcacaulis machinosus]|uniref:protein-tyrosine-phosphatase n=1 Tax=Asticcacaulis machinosus TaxID=2984211 RepID=A0ABT5HLV0_9CAUL|nr:low molecular weight protein-tyrosine-phosphatase [Asticcacaulis machinosus]MDC7677157.1 low molecular weight phosphotyrosine protein phosphatase [Asticcacaulis machinosus]